MPKKVKQLPEEFKTLEEVDIKVDIQKRHYLIELDKNTSETLQERARRKGVNPSNLVAELIHEQLAEAV
jgi:hypothetical protein